MIELRTLGIVDLRTPDGAVAGSVLAQPKRLALLVYLAVSGGFVRRDSLLALFWPESDDERARAALRQAVRYLRRSLGEAAIVGRGDEELAVAPGALRCDTVEFRTAIAAGEHERALALYAGVWLPGFHADGAPEFERWMDEQRAALARDAVIAAGRLADSASGRGDVREALEWARRATLIEPFDGSAALRLVTLLDAAGDRAAALTAYDTYARRLADELEIEPSAELRAAAESIRGREVAQVAPARAAVRVMGEVQPARRRIGRFVAMAVVVAALGGAVLLRPRAPDLEPRRVLVAPFENQTLDAGLDPVGRMAADWITDGVSRTGHFEVVPSMAVWSSARHVSGSHDGIEPSSYRDLARETGAGVVVAGSYYRIGAALHLQAQLLDASTGRVIRTVGAVAVRADSLLEGIHRLRSDVLAALAPVGDTVYHVRMAASPPTYEAYREYLTGMDAFISGDPRTALHHFQRSAAADADYPMPRLATAIAQLNLGNFEAADSLVADVGTSRDRLGPLEQGTLDFVLAHLTGNQPAAYDAMVRAAAIAPGTINEYEVGEMARRMNRPREAIRVLRALGPERGELRGWRPYWREVTYAHHMLGEYRHELREARRARRLYPDDPLILSFEVAALAALGRTSDVDARIRERMAGASDGWPRVGPMMVLAASELAAHGHDDAALRMRERAAAWFDALPAAQHTPSDRYDHGVALARAGRLDDARHVLEDLTVEQPDNLVYLGALGVVLARSGDREGAAGISDRISLYDSPMGRSGPINRLWGGHTYLRAAIAAQLGDGDRAVELLRQSHAEGLWIGPEIHADPDFEPIRNHAAFSEWLRPKG